MVIAMIMWCARISDVLSIFRVVSSVVIFGIVGQAAMIMPSPLQK